MAGQAVSDQYILDAAGKPVPCKDLLEWGRWMQTADRKVAHTEIDDHKVSTVFLGLDHKLDRHGPGPPILFETMIFSRVGTEDFEGCWRYSTRAEAEQGHAKVVEDVRIRLGVGQ